MKTFGFDPMCTHNHVCSDSYTQSSMHTKIHAAIHACENTHSHPNMQPCIQVCMHACVWPCGWMCMWIELIIITDKPNYLYTNEMKQYNICRFSGWLMPLVPILLPGWRIAVYRYVGTYLYGGGCFLPCLPGNSAIEAREKWEMKIEAPMGWWLAAGI